jgi:hypothetical protein
MPKDIGFNHLGDQQRLGSCVAGFAINFLISPLAAPFGIEVPQADTSTMLPVLMGMLGLGGLRSYEKSKGLTK